MKKLAPALLFVYSFILTALNFPPQVVAPEGTDAPTYLGWYETLRHFQLPYFGHRTPVYPLLIALTEIFGSWKNVIWVQAFFAALSASALFYLVLAALHRIKAERTPVTVFLTVLLVSDFSVLGWHGLITTESFAMSFLILWITAHLGAIQKIELPLPVRVLRPLALLLDLTLMFLRPTFYFMPCLWYLLLAVSSIDRDRMLKNAVIVTVAGFAFCSLNLWQSGRFEISNVGRMGKLGNLLSLGFVQEKVCAPGECSNETERALKIYAIETVDDPWIFKTRLLKSLFFQPWDTTLDAINQDVGREVMPQYVLRALPRLQTVFRDRWLYADEGGLYTRSKVYQKLTERYAEYTERWTYFALYWSLALSLLMFITWMFKTGPRPDWDWLRTILLFATGYVAGVTVLGAYNEWTRLLIPVRLLTYFLILYVGLDLVALTLRIYRKNTLFS